MLISGSVAIVTGGARGLGKAFCEALLERNAKVCFGDIDEAEGRTTEEEFHEKYGQDKAVFVRCDVTSDADFKNLFNTALSKFKILDLVVNNAGIMNERIMEKQMDINLLGTMRGTNLAIETMRKDKGGNGGLVINVASAGGLFPVFFMPAYVASKYGVVGFTRSWADNPIIQSKFGIKIALLCPGTTNTNILLNFDAEDTPKVITFQENKEAIRKIVYLTDLLEVKEVADAFIKLVEREDNNGAVMTVEKKFGARYRYTRHPHKL